MKYNYLSRQASLWSLVFLLMVGLGLSGLQAQCSYLDDQFGSSPAPTDLGVANPLTTCIFGGEYREVTNLVAGSTYRFETCGDTEFDTQITIFPAGGGAALAFNDDFCGTQSSVEFTPTVSGTYDVQINEFFCTTNSTCMTLTATLVSGGGPPPPPPSTCGSGEVELNETYCYGNNDNTGFNYESADGSSPMTLTFTAGGIESCCDNITIYDGPDATSPVLFSGNNGGDLSGVSVTSTGTQLYMEVDSDNSVSCTSESSCCLTSWAWTVCNGSILPPPGAPDNDLCINATPIPCGETVTGSTTLATDNNPGSCVGAGDGSSGGVWYTITGTGGEITASTCGSSFDTQLAIYEGGCGTLACVDGNDDFCGTQSLVSWNSTPGTEYAIYLDGFSGSNGEFSLSMSCAVACDIALTGSSSTPETCPGDNDGTISVSASCSSCASIEYSVGAGFQPSGTFSGLAAGSYTVTARDTGDPSCSATTTVSVGAGTGGAVQAPWVTTDVGTPGVNTYSQNPCAGGGTFSISSGANNSNPMMDAVGFIGQTICGNGEITAKIESVDAFGYGGLMVRESSSPGAKQYALFSNLTNILLTQARTMTNAPKTTQLHNRPFPVWLRLSRMGNYIFSYWSTNGVNYNMLQAAIVPMNTCVEMGMAAYTTTAGQKTAVFSNVSISGGISLLEEIPGSNAFNSMVNAEPATLFPNPAQDLVTVDFGSGVEVETQMVLRNKLGQQVRQLFVEPGLYRQELNVGDLTSGMYIIELHREGQPVEVLRFIKQ